MRAECGTLRPNAHIIYAGDFNTNDSTDASYQTMIARDRARPRRGQSSRTTGPTLDLPGIMTESATDLEYRDDFQFVSGLVLNATSGMQLGARLVRRPSATTAATAFHGAVNAASNTALSDLSNQQTILNDSDDRHRPFADRRRLRVPDARAHALVLMALAGVPLLWAGIAAQESAILRQRSSAAAEHACRFGESEA